MEKLIKYTVENRIARITINRPEKRNALSPVLIAELMNAFSQANGDNSVKVIVLAAEGEVFSAGADLNYLQQLQTNSYQENLEDTTKLKDLFVCVYNSSKIVIAEVQGHAIAGGCGLVSVCDFVFAVPDAQFGYTEVKIGFVPAIVSLFAIKRLGERIARDLLLTGRLIKSEEAKEFGLVNFIIEHTKLSNKVNEFATQLIVETSSTSIAFTKELIRTIQEMPFDDALNWATEMNAKIRETEDFKKGITSFLTKTKIGW
ncbi:enoyl-CoA hydratase/isomerase family protein [Solitalea koreensis]|uniref:Methylglutaconyl-CoA hydratase n=1 Tax=Solitalea koreensis TaxID=543615 RepID=A0A521BI60_9SPHI|nr:enoyl-CoA hydratase-related protein [Solitalea koreensis]SMO46785.1 methylglutaconyl-CoA hydratase [Solitalea koreensis]